LRERQKRNLAATLVLSVGVPMILGGDELSHSQEGNNNAYCQDSELTWLEWELNERQKEFLEFLRKVIIIRKTQPVFQRRKFFLGRAIRGSDIKDISFFGPSGQEMSDDDWNAGFVKCLGVRLAGDLINDENERGELIVGDTLLLLLNAHWEPIPFALPGTKEGHFWDPILDTAEFTQDVELVEGGKPYPLGGRSLAVLVARMPQDHRATPTQSRLQATVRETTAGNTAPGPSPI